MLDRHGGGRRELRLPNRPLHFPPLPHHDLPPVLLLASTEGPDRKVHPCRLLLHGCGTSPDPC